VTLPLRKCPYCGKIKSEEDFPTRGKGVLKRRRACRECYLARRREQWRKQDKKRNLERRQKWLNDSEYRERNKKACQKYKKNNIDIIRNRAKESSFSNRMEVIKKYGGRCVCCGENRWQFLAIDHIDSNGSKDRKKRGGAVALYRFLAKNPIQDGYQILCANCNTAIAFYGHCPHGNIPDRKPVNGRPRSIF